MRPVVAARARPRRVIRIGVELLQFLGLDLPLDFELAEIGRAASIPRTRADPLRVAAPASRSPARRASASVRRAIGRLLGCTQAKRRRDDTAVAITRISVVRLRRTTHARPSIQLPPS